jgi:hypothetical protein
MALLQEFLNPDGWTVQEWDAEPGLGLGPDSFLAGSRLLIGQVPAGPPDLQLCTLAWLNDSYNLCTIPAIPYDPKSGSLKGNALVHLPGRPAVFCHMAFKLEQVAFGGLSTLHLHGKFEPIGEPTGGTGGPGTLAAEASAGSGSD